MPVITLDFSYDGNVSVKSDLLDEIVIEIGMDEITLSTEQGRELLVGLKKILEPARKEQANAKK